MRIPLKSLKVTHYLSTPLSFTPPFRANVQETYQADTDINTLQSVVERAKEQKRPLLRSLLTLRNKIVARFGFKTDLEEGKDYGPFDVSFINEDHLKASYEDPHFSFYAEIIHKNSKLTLYSGVHYKSPQGMTYFWLIYPFHVAVFKSLLAELAVK